MSYKQLIEGQRYQIEAYLREWIYRYVQRDKLRGGRLYKLLRQSHRRYRKGDRAKRIIIPNRVGIEHLPAIVNKKNGSVTGKLTRFWQARNGRDC